ncbi:hypothetical protein K431DRAFT_196869, partial [Polychaeton citri CBS 116435]
QPNFRRPYWAQHEKSFRTYMRKDLAVDRSTGDYGVENFSYDETHLDEWQMPEGLIEDLPTELKQRIDDWQAAGAAVCTALERIQKLYTESLYRGWPERRLSHLSRRTSSMSSSQASPFLPPSMMGTSDRIAPSPLALAISQQMRSPPLGMESPPFTPLDSNCPGTPTNWTDSKSIPPPPDLTRIKPELSPISCRRDSTLSTTCAPIFDENAWETYLNTFRAELDDIRVHAIVRLKGYGYTVDKLRVESGSDAEFKDAVDRFTEWWLMMKEKVRSYDARVKELEEPDLDFVKMERTAKGMIV